MRSISRVAVTSLITVAIAMSGGAALAADDDGPAPDDTGSAKVVGPPEWARLDCPAGLDPDERVALRTEHRAMMDSRRTGARAEMEQLRTEHRSQMQAMRGDRRAQTQTLREDRRAERGHLRSWMTDGGPAGDTDS